MNAYNREPQGHSHKSKHQGAKHSLPQTLPDVTQIRLGGNKLSADIFSRVANEMAKAVSERQGRKDPPKPTQLRKFYDEICMWDSKLQTAPERFYEYLPLILMLKAKVAYSKERSHVNESYEHVLNHCLSELEQAPKPATMRNVKLFMEAFTGFYKVHGPK